MSVSILIGDCREKLRELPDAIRPILSELGAIVEEADRIKGVAA